MCGIVGYVGNMNAVDVVFEGLKTLEYRGYDSAGIAAVGDTLKVFKTTGRVARLKAILPADIFHTAIGHTRWATHGTPSERNAHPHLSFDGKIAVVHNGIIENCAYLKSLLQAKGIRFVSDTDSEVIAHLLACEGYRDCGVCDDGGTPEDFLHAVENVLSLLDGQATFLAVREGDDKIYCAKRGASLTIGLGDEENFVASDSLALTSHTQKLITLEDGDVATLSAHGIIIKNNGKLVSRRPTIAKRREAKDCKCFMRSEIEEIPLAVARTFDAFFENENKIAQDKIKSARRLYFVGCGTAYHACIYAKRLFEDFLAIPCEAVCASEFDEQTISQDSAAVFISQSGETADTVLALKSCKRQGIYAIAICNVQGSLLSLTADATYFTEAGAEIAVAATKSYVSQLVTLYLLAHKCADKPLDAEFKRKLVDSLNATLALDALPLAKDKNVFFIGKGLDAVTGREAALKVKEITYKMTDFYPAGELKHGPIALIDKDSLVVIIATKQKDKRRIEATTQELKSRGATVFGISAIGDFGADKTIYLPSPPDEYLYPIVAILPLQRFALDLSEALGLNPDKPRNLAKSVTVI